MQLLPSDKVSAIITMSTPHTLPPARFDRRIDTLYAGSRAAVATSTTPVLSICGGATDSMIPSEYCHLPLTPHNVGYRKTVFTTGMDGVWTGVGHQSMVWCHQVRWRVARAALLIGSSRSALEIGDIFDDWFRTDAVASLSDAPHTVDTHAFPLTEIKAGDLLVLRPAWGWEHGLPSQPAFYPVRRQLRFHPLGIQRASCRPRYSGYTSNTSSRFVVYANSGRARQLRGRPAKCIAFNADDAVEPTVSAAQRRCS